MGESYQEQIDFVGLEPESIIGKETVVVPFHVIKYCLREGGGPPIEPGMTIYCMHSIYLIDGTPVALDRRVVKYLFGRNRLIKGLQQGFKGVKKHEKLRLIISGEYGYKDQKDIKLVPPNSKLIFQIDVVDFYRISPSNMTDAELYYQVYYNLDLSTSSFQKGDQNKGLTHIVEAYFYAKKIRHYKCLIQGKIILKWGNVLYSQGQYQKALTVISQIDRYSSELAEDTIRLNIKLLQGLNRREDLQKLVQTTYKDNIYNNSIRRICVQYYKQTKNVQKLRKLPGYNAKKDKLMDMTKEHQMNMYMPFLF